MFRKVFTRFLSVALFLIGVSATMAQIAPVSGRVQLKKADGTTVPVVGALVEVFRVDIKASLPADKTDKKGVFNFAGLPLGSTVVLSVSAPGAKPGYLPNVRPGRDSDKLLITLDEGDGRRWTEQEIRDAISGASTASPGETTRKPTEAEKKQDAERQKQLAEYNEKKAKIENTNAIVNKAASEGKAAFDAKNYDLAIAKFTEGYQADTKFVGSAPFFLNSRGAALNKRGTDTFNASVKLTDASAKVEGYAKSKKDLSDAAAGFIESWELLKAPADPKDITPQNLASNKQTALEGAKESFRLMVATEQVDPEKIAPAKTFLADYVAAQTDPVKKAEALLILADLYRVAADSGNAIAAYKEILIGSPENLDALAGVGLSLVNAGYISGNKEQLQEGANYLQKFANLAPDSHKYKKDALGLIETLKTNDKVVPQKATATGKKKP